MKLTNIEQVQNIVGKLPAPRDLKVIDHIDEQGMRWLSHSSFAFIAFGKAGHIRLTIAGGEMGFASAVVSGPLQVRLARLDNAGIVEQGSSFGALFLVSGMEETLRVNGKVSSIDNGVATLVVEECYLHCAKAFRRAEFWAPQSVEQSHAEIADFINQSKFLVLASINHRGQADVSPKGDPEAFLLQEENGCICFADRPGNKRIDSFRNIIETPAISLMALVPGRNDVLEIEGTATLCTDEPLMQRFSIQNRKPKLVTRVTPASMRISPSQVIAQSNLWPAEKPPEDLVPAEIFKAHIKRSREKSLQAKVARAAVSLPGAMEKGLEWDYKNNMY